MSKKMNFKFVQMDKAPTPDVIEDKRSELVRWGSNNQFPQELLKISIQSSLHAALLDKKIKALKGKGIYVEDVNEKTNNFLNNVNPFEDINSLYEKCATDLEIFGGFALQNIWTKDKKEIAEIYHMPFQNIRANKKNIYDIVEKYYYYDDWKRYTRYNDAEQFEIFGSKNKSKPQLLYTTKYNATNSYYPLPSYIGGLDDISTLNQISNFHNAAISNNFSPGIIIFLRGSTSSEEQDAIIEQLNNKYQGAENAGTPGVFFLSDESQEPKIEQMQTSDLDKQYDTLTKSIKESVVLSHQVPKNISGLETAGKLGSSKELVQANQIFKKDYIEPHQEILLNSFNKILKINNLEEIKIKNTNPSLFLYSEKLLKDSLTEDEIRELFGYKPLEDGQKTNDKDGE